MAVENAGAVRQHARAPHAAAGASRNPGAADAGDAPSGFLSLLGAATDMEDPSTLGAGLPAWTDGAAAGTALAATAAEPGLDDAATLAAWSGLLQAPAVAATPLVAAGTVAGQPASALIADASTVAGQGGRGGRGALPGGASAIAGDTAAASAARLTNPAKPTDPAIAADGRSPLPGADAVAGAAVAPLAGDPGIAVAPGTPHSFAATQQLRATNIAGQAAAARAHVAAFAPTAAASAHGAALDGSTAAAAQQALVSVSGGAASAVSDADVRSARAGAASTVSLADGNPGRWAGLMSDIFRSPQSETGAGSFGGGGASQERGADAPSHAGESAGAATIGFGATGSGGAGGAGGASAGGDGGFQSSGGGTAQPMAATGGMVMSPDEWLAATTPALGNGNGSGPQTAELTVDAFGAPVDVRISLDGSDAQVTFQSDQADTRAMLGGAVADLQNLMQQEGLVLAGVTVNSGGARADGGAGAGDAGSGGRGGDARRPARAEAAGSIDAAAAAPARSRAAASRGGLDLFA